MAGVWHLLKFCLRNCFLLNLMGLIMADNLLGLGWSFALRLSRFGQDAQLHSEEATLFITLSSMD